MSNLSELFGISTEMLKEFEYIDECVFSTEIKEEAFDELLGCNCNGPCVSKDECACLKFNQVYDSNGILADVTKNGIIECSDRCKCHNCVNKVVQNGKIPKIKVIHSGDLNKRYQVITEEPIPQGTFVAEYVGEVITVKEAHERLLTQNTYKNNYLFCIDEEFFDKKNEIVTCIDAREYGNITRFINHGCEPNLEIKLVRTGIIIPRLTLFSKRDILMGEELSYNYGTDFAPNLAEGPPCKCGANRCCGNLPFSKIPSIQTS
uniref:Histone-lysine N-methyltransferase set-23 n=1 Tax=Panagrolaimus superbus TaxID=310955 RepID=A0A914YB43_9BILA